jgi:hypothetical protein
LGLALFVRSLCDYEVKRSDGCKCLYMAMLFKSYTFSTVSGC